MSDRETPPPAIAALAADPRAVPLAYGYLRVAPAPRTVQRVGDSAWHRAAVYACAPYHKSISRCLRVEG